MMPMKVSMSRDREPRITPRIEDMRPPRAITSNSKPGFPANALFRARMINAITPLRMKPTAVLARYTSSRDAGVVVRATSVPFCFSSTRDDEGMKSPLRTIAIIRSKGRRRCDQVAALASPSWTTSTLTGSSSKTKPVASTITRAKADSMSVRLRAPASPHR